MVLISVYETLQRINKPKEEEAFFISVHPILGETKVKTFHSAFEYASAFLLGSCLLYGQLFRLPSPTTSSNCSASEVLTRGEDAVHSAGLAPQAFRDLAGPGRLWAASDLMTHISTDSYSQILTCSFQGIQWGISGFGAQKVLYNYINQP